MDGEDLREPTVQSQPRTVSEGQMQTLGDMFSQADLSVPQIPPPSPAPPQNGAGDDDALSRQSDTTSQRQDQIKLYGLHFATQMDTVLKTMANDHGLVIPRIRQAIEKADGTDALVVRNYLEALKSKAGMLKQKAYMDDQLTESVRVAMVGKIGMVECEVQMTLAETESFLSGLDSSRFAGFDPYTQPISAQPTSTRNASGKTALATLLMGAAPPSTPRFKSKEPDLLGRGEELISPVQSEELIHPVQSGKLKEPLNDGDAGFVALPVPIPDPKKLFKDMTKSELINWYALAQKAVYIASWSKKYTHFDEGTLQDKLTKFGAQTQCVTPVTLETADQIRTLSNQGKSTTHIIIKSAYERKKMCDEMFALFQKAYLMDVERAAEKDSIFDQQDKYEELKKVTQPYCVPDLAKCTISEYHQAFMSKIEHLEVTDASNKKEVCMALMDGYIEPIHLMLKKDEWARERKHLYTNIMSIQLQARKFEDELQLDHQRKLYTKYFSGKTQINVGSASCQWKLGVKNYKASPQESKPVPGPKVPRPGAAANTGQPDPNEPKDPEFWQSEAGQQHASKARVKAAEHLAKFDLAIDEDEIVRSNFVCWNCGGFHMNTRIKKKEADKVDKRIPCAWMKKNANLPKNVMAVRKAVIDEGKDAVLPQGWRNKEKPKGGANGTGSPPADPPKVESDAGIQNQALSLPGNVNFTVADPVLRGKRKWQEQLQKQDESYRLSQAYQKDPHANGIRYSSVLERATRRKFAPSGHLFSQSTKRDRDEPSSRQRKRARSHSNFSGGTRDGWDIPTAPGWSRSAPAQGWGVAPNRDDPSPAKVPAKVVVEDVSQMGTTQELTESQESHPELTTSTL